MGGSTTLTRIDGLPVAVGTAHAFLTRLKPAFERAFPGITLHVYSGYRSYEDQKKIFLQRYVPANQVNGRRVYDYRWWNGILYARISSAGTVAQPGTSNHGDGRALDIRDSASTPGVTRYGNARSLWIRNNAARYGFEPDGYKNFNEPWHIKFTGNQWSAPAGSPATTPKKDDPIVLTPEKMKELNMQIITLPGKAGKRQGGFYAVVGDEAVFLGRSGSDEHVKVLSNGVILINSQVAADRLLKLIKIVH